MKVNVTDHALIRWLERVHGIDMDAMRAEIAEAVHDALAAGATALTADGAHYVLNPQTRTVITVLTLEQRAHRSNVAMKRGLASNARRAAAARRAMIRAAMESEQ